VEALGREKLLVNGTINPAKFATCMLEGAKRLSLGTARLHSAINN